MPVSNVWKWPMTKRPSYTAPDPKKFAKKQYYTLLEAAEMTGVKYYQIMYRHHDSEGAPLPDGTVFPKPRYLMFGRTKLLAYTIEDIEQMRQYFTKLFKPP